MARMQVSNSDKRSSLLLLMNALRVLVLLRLE
jgi:hypothetical protein